MAGERIRLLKDEKKSIRSQFRVVILTFFARSCRFLLKRVGFFTQKSGNFINGLLYFFRGGSDIGMFKNRSRNLDFCWFTIKRLKKRVSQGFFNFYESSRV
jgi:hypothetical protein